MIAGGSAEMIGMKIDTKGMVEIPNLLRLEHGQAMQLASESGLSLHPTMGEGRVYAQMPDPGALVERGCEVKVLVRPGESVKASRVRVPELRGLSIREARRLLLGLGLGSSIRGSGLVKRQHPKAGAHVGKESTVRLVCDPKCRIGYAENIKLTNGAVR
jgi:stage V sporulation protein D (sporulation-specific penicillin-binding protein)/penicillin-binding protein 2B